MVNSWWQDPAGRAEVKRDPIVIKYVSRRVRALFFSRSALHLSGRLQIFPIISPAVHAFYIYRLYIVKIDPAASIHGALSPTGTPTAGLVRNFKV